MLILGRDIGWGVSVLHHCGCDLDVIFGLAIVTFSLINLVYAISWKP